MRCAANNNALHWNAAVNRTIIKRKTALEINHGQCKDSYGVDIGGDLFWMPALGSPFPSPSGERHRESDKPFGKRNPPPVPKTEKENWPGGALRSAGAWNYGRIVVWFMVCGCAAGNTALFSAESVMVYFLLAARS